MDKSTLTVDYREMEKLTAKDALKSTRREAPLPSFLASLTPTQLAEMFPDYFKRALPDIGRATTGATPMTGPSGLGQTARPYSPPVRTQARSSPGVKLRDGRTMPGQEPGVLLDSLGLDSSDYRKPQQSPGVKLSWQQALEQGASEKRTRTLLQEGKVNPLGKTRLDAGGDRLTTNQRKHFYALAVAEVGKDPQAVMGFMETVYNRFAANKERYGNDFSNALNTDFRNMSRSSIYFEPLRSGTTGMRNYNNALNEIENNPNMFKQFDQYHSNVLLGTNYSYFGTHNASAGVYADAQRGGYDAVPSTAHKMPGGEGTYNKTWEMPWIRSIATEMNMWEASGKSLKDASSIKEPDPSQTGRIDYDAMLKPGEVPKELRDRISTTIPKGLDPEAAKFLGTITPVDQVRMIENINRIGVEQANRLFQSSRDAAPQKASSAVTRDVAGRIIESKAPEKLIPGDVKYLDTSRPGVMESIQNVNPTLLSIADEGARRFMENNPGYKVVINGTVKGGKMQGGGGSGYRPGGGRHGRGLALDTTIVAPDGTALSNYQSGKYARLYQQLQNFEKTAQEKYFPGYSGNMRSGMYFTGEGGKAYGYGEMDLMHRDFGSRERQLGRTEGKGYIGGSMGNWEQGWSEKAMRMYNINPEDNMGMAEFRKLFGYDVAEARRQANKQLTAMKATSAEGLATASEVEPKDQAPNGAIDPYGNLGTTINLGEYNVPKDMPFSTEGFDPAFTKYWNTIMTQEQRAAAMDEVYRQYQNKTSGVPSFLMPSNEEIQKRIREGMESDYRARIKRGEIQPAPLTDAATVMPKAPQSSTMTIGQPQLDVQGTMAADQKTKVQPTPEAPKPPKPEPPPMPKQEPLPLPADSLVPNYLGGGQQFVGEGSAIVDAAGKVKARFGGGEKVQVTPQHRMSGSELLTQARSTQASGEQMASEKQASMEKQQKPRPKPNTPQHDPGLSIQENTRLLAQSSYPYKTTSNHRAMHRARNFSELSIDPAAGHFSEGATNMK